MKLLVWVVVLPVALLLWAGLMLLQWLCCGGLGCGGALAKSAKGAIEINAKADGIDEGNSVKSLVENGGSE